MSDPRHLVPLAEPLLARIEGWVADIPGWTPIDQLQNLFLLAVTTDQALGAIVEVGSWCGRSAVVLAEATRLVGEGRVHCVDLFPERDDWRENADGSFSFTTTIGGKTFGGYQDQTVWREPYLRDIVPVYAEHPSLLERFRRTVAAKGVDDLVDVHRGDIETFFASGQAPASCRLAFLDGDHGFAAVCRDIDALEPLMPPGAWLCFDDAYSGYAGVDRAIEERVLGSGRYDLVLKPTRKLVVARRGR